MWLERRQVGPLALWVAWTALQTAAAPAVAQSDGGPPVLNVIGPTVQAQGMTPGGPVIWFGMGTDVVEYSEVRTEVQQPATADSQGRVTLSFAGAVPAFSIWVAVDLTTGTFVTGSPTGFTASQFTLSTGSIVNGAGSSPDQLSDSADVVHVLLVRPGQGAWAGTIGRGSSDDQSNPGDANLLFSFSSLTPLLPNGAPAPSKLLPNDLVFVGRPRTMDLGTATVS